LKFHQTKFDLKIKILLQINNMEFTHQLLNKKMKYMNLKIKNLYIQYLIYKNNLEN